MRNVTVNSIGEYIREQREQAKISMRQLAQSAGVSNPYLSQIERGLRKPSADILQQIAKGLRISAEALYVQAGILEDRPADSGVRSALLADPQLSERQKQVLIEIYESFRRENAAASGSAEDESAEQETDPAALAAGAPGAEADIIEAIAEAIVAEASGAEASGAEASGAEGSGAEGSGAGGESPPDDTSDKSGHPSDQAVPPIRAQAVPPIR
jgi:transcriptional regulator with XRE-family HTH domain